MIFSSLFELYKISEEITKYTLYKHIKKKARNFACSWRMFVICAISVKHSVGAFPKLFEILFLLLLFHVQYFLHFAINCRLQFSQLKSRSLNKKKTWAKIRFICNLNTQYYSNPPNQNIET